MKRIHLLFAVLGFIPPGCNTDEPPAAQARPDMVSTADLSNPGKCWSKGYSCMGPRQCGPSDLSQCQEGMCCSGEVDVQTCTCHCNGGPECPIDYACCVGSKARHLPDQGALKCRYIEDCRDPI